MRAGTKSYRKRGDPRGARGLYAAMRRFIEHRGVMGGTEASAYNLERYIHDFIAWAEVRAVTYPEQVTQAVLQRYQRWLYHYRKKDGAPLSISSQRGKLDSLARVLQIADPQRGAVGEPGHRTGLATADQALAACGADGGGDGKGDGRGGHQCADQAMMEVLYATGMRRMEIARLEIGDIDGESCVVLI
jgi:integrase/recombinase XerD